MNNNIKAFVRQEKEVIKSMKRQIAKIKKDEK